MTGRSTTQTPAGRGRRTRRSLTLGGTLLLAMVVTAPAAARVDPGSAGGSGQTQPSRLDADLTRQQLERATAKRWLVRVDSAGGLAVRAHGQPGWLLV